MNTDKRMRELLDEYAGRPSEALQDRVRDRLVAARKAKRRAVGFRWAFAGVLILAAALGGLIMAPRVAFAERLKQVHEAIANAKSVELTMVRRANGKERVVYRLWSEGRTWRRHRSYSPGTAVDCLVKDGTKWTYAEGAPTAIQEPYDPGRGSDELDSDVDALEFAKEVTAPAGILAPSGVVLAPHRDVEGRKTFCIVADRDDGRLHATMVVDAGTDLPISITMDIRSQAPGSLHTVQTRSESNFVFNEPLDQRLFEPVFGPSVKIVASSIAKPHLAEVELDSIPGDFFGTAGALYAPDVLYSIPYGSEPEQIGAESASSEGAVGNAGFAIRKGGDLLIADRVNGKVKEFDPQGKLVWNTVDDLDHPAFVAPGPDGSVFAVSGPRREILSKFGRRGELLWSVRAPGAIPPELHLDGRLGELSVSNDGLVAARLDRTDWMVCFTQDGKFESVRPATAVTADGRVLSFIPVVDAVDATDAVLMDGNGRILSKTRLSPMPPDAAVVPAGDIAEVGEALRDDHGCWYRVWVRHREKHVELTPDLQIRSEAVVTQYSADGIPTAQGVVDMSPFGLPQSIAVGPDGALYALGYHKDRVSLFRYRLPSAPPR